MSDLLFLYQQRLEETLQKRLPSEGGRIVEALRYALLGGGKRFRAALIYAVAEDFSIPLVQVDAAACAIEAIHAYSLIHDDLPAMDNDDWRRGKASMHKAFDEATAILTGDALNTLAFSWLTDSPLVANIQIEQIRILANAAGWAGMIGGQMHDIATTGQPITFDFLQAIHHGKTGALIRAALHLGALPDDSYGKHRETLHTLGEQLGIAYQIADDILDATVDSSQLGKTAGKDEAQGKNTYPAFIGLEESRAAFHEHSEKAQAAAACLPNGAPHLSTLLAVITKRAH